MRVGVLGFGTVGYVVVRALLAGSVPNCQLSIVLDKDSQLVSEARKSHERHDVTFTTDADKLFSANLDLIVEVASHSAVRMYARRSLESNVDFLVASVGALSDQALFDKLSQTVQTHNSRLLLISGALPAVDWMRSASLHGSSEVMIIQSKPTASWVETSATDIADISSFNEKTCFYEGTARNVSKRFPKSSNIVAMLGISTVGLDNAFVRLVCDPTSNSMKTFVEFKSQVGDLTTEWSSSPSSANTSTSIDVPYTVIKSLHNLSSNVVFGI